MKYTILAEGLQSLIEELPKARSDAWTAALMGFASLSRTDFPAIEDAVREVCKKPATEAGGNRRELSQEEQNEHDRTDDVSRHTNRRQGADSGTKLKKKAKREFVLNFVKERNWSGTLKELKNALEKRGLKVSCPTLSRYLRGTRYVGSPRRAAKGRNEREAVADPGPENLSHVDAYTMPDDVS